MKTLKDGKKTTFVCGKSKTQIDETVKKIQGKSSKAASGKTSPLSSVKE